jgi:ABC-type Mn2+/Zn2+ transport system ATPase subunit
MSVGGVAPGIVTVGAMTEPLIRFEHVSCSYGSEPVVSDVDLSVGEGEFVGIVGPSGGGKTTLLRALLGMIEPVAGNVTRRRGASLGYVPQIEAVDWNFPVTVRDVVAMTMQRPRWRRRDVEVERRIDDLLGHLGLAGLAGRHIRELSGGQQQRVFVARALVDEPDLLVLDEPAGSVDVATRHEMLHLLADLHHGGTSILLTTHDINGLAAHLPRLICFNRTVLGDGSPAQVLVPEVLERTYGAPMDVLQHGGMPVVVEHRGHGPHVSRIADGRTA